MMRTETKAGTPFLSGVKYSGFETLREALDAHKAWLNGEANGKRADLSGVNLSGTNLSGAILSGADLSDANLSGAILSGADLSDANLSGAILSGTDMSRAILSGANMSRTDLSGTYLSGTDLSGTNLSGAYLSGTVTWEQYLAEVVPALCTAGGKTLEEVAAGWDCHDWSNCPMHIAFDAPRIKDVPALYRREAMLFIKLFDAGAIPKPVTPRCSSPRVPM